MTKQKGIRKGIHNLLPGGVTVEASWIFGMALLILLSGILLLFDLSQQELTAMRDVAPQSADEGVRAFRLWQAAAQVGELLFR